MITRLRKTVGQWAKLTGRLVAKDDIAVDDPDDARLYSGDAVDMYEDGDEHAPNTYGEDTAPLNDDYYQKPSLLSLRNSIGLSPGGEFIFDDCCRIDHWARTHDHTFRSIQRLRRKQMGNPLAIAVVRDNPGKVVTEGQARIYADQVLKSLVQEFPGPKEATTSLRKLVDMVKDTEIPIWWPSETLEDGTVTGLDVRIQAHPEAVLCAHWVSLPKPGTRKTPSFGVT